MAEGFTSLRGRGKAPHEATTIDTAAVGVPQMKRNTHERCPAVAGATDTSVGIWIPPPQRGHQRSNGPEPPSGAGHVLKGPLVGAGTDYTDVLT